ncbi:tyrosine-type recombinase/integrase [Streptosporangium subroseum]|uniref:tyrosine-type recombinase/integrase n=1 Tax=Streptosporangium subroseum TaxID=106412 RepID=UPI00341D1328
MGSRRPDGRMSPRSINTICEQIGRWHDAEHTGTARHLSPFRLHDLRHIFAFNLAQQTGADAYELQRRLGHASQRYIDRYTNPPEHIAAGYVEELQRSRLPRCSVGRKPPGERIVAETHVKPDARTIGMASAILKIIP